MVDFGAEHSFAKAAERIQEHYGIKVPVEAIRQYTLRHGRRISQIPAQSDCAAKILVAQMDGTMIPVVQPGNGPELEEAPVSAAHRYLTDRHDCLDYASAQAQDLPIGSGEIESGHRHVIQKRLKVAGAWWKETNAHSMLNLRTARANHQWKHYWTSQN